MGPSFDPYHKWLGIPPEEQPPSHYRLLGIREFETDPDVIEAAADQRMGHLRRYQTSQHAELSQRLLNEVAAARICLLNPSKRAAYDEQLKLARPAATAPTGPQPVAVAFPIVEEEEWSPRIARRAMRAGRRKPSSNMGPIIGMALAAGLLLFAFVAWRIASRETPNVARPPSAGQNRPGQPRAAVPPAGIGMGPKTVSPSTAPTGPGSTREAFAPTRPPQQRRQVPQPPSQKHKAELKVDSDRGSARRTAAPSKNRSRHARRRLPRRRKRPR